MKLTTLVVIIVTRGLVTSVCACALLLEMRARRKSERAQRVRRLTELWCVHPAITGAGGASASVARLLRHGIWRSTAGIARIALCMLDLRTVVISAGYKGTRCRFVLVRMMRNAAVAKSRCVISAWRCRAPVCVLHAITETGKRNALDVVRYLPNINRPTDDFVKNAIMPCRTWMKLILNGATIVASHELMW